MDIEKLNPDGVVTISASVATGMEEVAASEVTSKIMKTHDITAPVTKQGRVYFTVTKHSLPDVHSLRSLDRLYLVICRVENYTYPDSKDDALLDMKKLAQKIDWAKVSKFWSYNLPFLKEKKLQEDLGRKSAKKRKLENDTIEPVDCPSSEGSTCNVTNVSADNSEFQGDGKESANPSTDNGNRETSCDHSIRFRVSTNRVGKKQPITSPEASYQFGGEIQNITQWKVDLSGYNLEILLCLGVNSLEVTLALTLQSLHRRNITHFGITTLRATTSYNMLRLCNIKPADIVVDPMSGSGSIPIEGALEWHDNFHIAGDIVNAAITRCRGNVEFLNDNPSFAKKYIDKVTRKRLPLDVIKWDATNLPLKSDSVDVIVSDLPFGKRLGSKVDNRKLYSALLEEMARVMKQGTGRACLLTQDKRTIIRALNALTEFWSLKKTLYINIGGLTAGIFLLGRTKNSFHHTEE